MKKTFKIICAILACAVLMCPLFAGCANSYGQYVENSFEYEIDPRSYSVDVNGSIKILFNDEGRYTVEYDIELFFGYNKQLVSSGHNGTTVTATGSGTKEVTVHENFPITWDTNGNAAKEEYAAKIRDIKITKEKGYNTSQSCVLGAEVYAIGFGVTAAVLTGAITAFFVIAEIISKKKSKSEKDSDQTE